MVKECNLPEIEPTKIPAETSAEAKPHKSKGEKRFDQIVYGGIAGVGTLLATLPIAYSFKHGKLGGDSYRKAVNWVEKKLNGVLSTKNSRAFAEEAVMTTSLMMGGNVMLLPVAVAEHYKVPLVAKLNTAKGDPTPPETIALAPKQTLWSLIEGRILAWGAVFGTLFTASRLLPNTFQTFTNEVGTRTHELTQWLRQKPKLAAPQHSVSFKIGELAALDVFATAAAASLLYVGGHFFARKHEEKKELRQTHPLKSHLNSDNADAPMPGTSEKTATPDARITGEKIHEGNARQAQKIALHAG